MMEALDFSAEPTLHSWLLPRLARAMFDDGHTPIEVAALCNYADQNWGLLMLDDMINHFDKDHPEVIAAIGTKPRARKTLREYPGPVRLR